MGDLETEMCSVYINKTLLEHSRSPQSHMALARFSRLGIAEVLYGLGLRRKVRTGGSYSVVGNYFTSCLPHRNGLSTQLCAWVSSQVLEMQRRRKKKTHNACPPGSPHQMWTWPALDRKQHPFLLPPMRACVIATGNQPWLHSSLLLEASQRPWDPCSTVCKSDQLGSTREHLAASRDPVCSQHRAEWS